MLASRGAIDIPVCVFPWVAGSGEEGQLGNGAQDSSSVPVPVAGMFLALAAGEKHVCGVEASEAAHCWGE